MRMFYNSHFRASASDARHLEARTMAYNDKLARWEADLDAIISMARELEALQDRYDSLELRLLHAEFEIERWVSAHNRGGGVRVSLPCTTDFVV